MNEKFHKFDVVLGNPPFQRPPKGEKDWTESYGKKTGRDRKSTGISIYNTLLSIFYKRVNNNGYLGMISPSTMFRSGIKDHVINKMIFNNILDIQLNNSKHFNIKKITGHFVLQKSKPSSDIINIKNKDEIIKINIRDFELFTGGLYYIPVNLTNENYHIFKKILNYSNEKYIFSRSRKNRSIYQIGFRGAPDTHTTDKYYYITYNGKFEEDGEEIDVKYRYDFDKNYPIENIQSVFLGKIRQYCLYVQNGDITLPSPISMSHFPKVDLNRFWSFDDLSREFKLTDKEKYSILKWSATNKFKYYDEL